MLQLQPVPEGSQPLSNDEICNIVLGRQSSYSKGLGWGPNPKSIKKSTSSASSSSYNNQAHIAEVTYLRDDLEKANRMIEQQRLSNKE